MLVARAGGIAEVRRAFDQALIEPSEGLTAADRRKARLLASLLLCLLALGSTSAALQALLIPNFESTLHAMLGGLTVIFFAYVGSRTRHYRTSAAVAVLALAFACVATGVRAPDDRVWYAFLLIAVVVATLFFSVRSAVVVAMLVFATLCALPFWVAELRSPDQIVPMLALHGVVSPLFLVAARHHALLERERQTELRKMDAKLADVQRLEAVARAAGNTAHDINNLITIIDANTWFLEKAQRSSPELSEIRAALDRTAQLNRGLMNTSLGEDPSVKEFGPYELVEEFLPILARLAGPSVAINLAGSGVASRVSMNPLRLEQVLMNLITNARDAMPNGGHIEIECRETTLAAEQMTNSKTRPGRYVVISVTDTGVGMDALTLERVFEPFFTTKPSGRGSGLGLAIVHEIIEKSGGHVVVSSRRGRGTAFRLHLPALTWQ